MPTPDTRAAGALASAPTPSFSEAAGAEAHDRQSTESRRTYSATPPPVVAAISPDLRLLVGALKWASLAASHLGAEGPRRVIEMYDAIWPLPEAVRRVFTLAIEHIGSDGKAPEVPSADDYILPLLGLHGLVSGGSAVAGETRGV